MASEEKPRPRFEFVTAYADPKGEAVIVHMRGRPSEVGNYDRLALSVDAAIRLVGELVTALITVRANLQWRLIADKVTARAARPEGCGAAQDDARPEGCGAAEDQGGEG